LKRLQQLAAHDRELEIAASIQRGLLQRTVPTGPEFEVAPVQRQANLVGGDWYDLELVDRTLTVVIGDASGKGIGAALMSAVTLSSLRAERGLGAGPARIIEQANKVLRDATESEAFTTLIYASLDLDSGRLRWLSMGHLSPFLLRASGSEGSVTGTFVEGAPNRVLGWFDDPGYSETVTDLGPGDRLVLFTDGFLEAKAPSGELFGEERLATALTKLAPLAPEKLGDALVVEVERFAAGKLEDDLTMLVLEYRGLVPDPGTGRLEVES
jgi:sigma-B regulation protein RsbU (phosphoserine phosphatase)